MGTELVKGTNLHSIRGRILLIDQLESPAAAFLKRLTVKQLIWHSRTTATVSKRIPEVGSKQG